MNKVGDITFKKLEEVREIEACIEDVFDVPFWENWNVSDSIEKDIRFLLFDKQGQACALLAYTENSEEIEIVQLDVEDYKLGRGNGIGTQVVQHFLQYVTKDKRVVGYAVSESVEFWKRLATTYDKEIYNYVVEDDYDSDYLMHFEIRRD